MILLAFVLIAIIPNEAHAAPPVGEVDNRWRNAGLYCQKESRGYYFSHETDDGTKRKEKGEFINGVWTVSGVSEWRAADGRIHRTMFNTGRNHP